MPRQRHDGLDAGRALAMILVVATHAAISFMITPIGWAIQDRSQHLAVDLYVWVVRAFAMPVFFWLSGYFARVVLDHSGAGGFVRHRMVRIAAPLAIGLMPCSLALNALWDWGRELAGRAGVAANVPKLHGSGLPITLGHLWYLYYLFAISLVALAAAGLARRWRIVVHPGAVLAGVAVMIAGTLALAGELQLDTPLGFAIDPVFAAFHGAFFAWGWVVNAHPGMLVRLATHAWRFAAVAPVLLLVLVGPLQAAADPATAGRPPLYAIAASGALSIALVAAFVGLCVRHATRAHPLFRLVSEASYWTYVAHFPLVILLQVVLAGVVIPGPLKWFAIVVMTSAACLASYELVIRRTALRRLLG